MVKNAEMIYYLYDDEDMELVGIDKTICSSMRLSIEDNGIKTITFFTQPEGTIYPEDDLPGNARRLSGFLWREDEIIQSIDDLITDQNKVLKKELHKKELQQTFDE
jgi:hypothetical protein